MSDLPERICIWEADKNDPNSTRSWTVSFPENHPDIYVRASLNTRPAAPVDGLLQSIIDFLEADKDNIYHLDPKELDTLRKFLEPTSPVEGLPFDRDTLGRFVREAWVRWAKTQPLPKPSWLVPYDELSEPDKEADRQIGEALARWTIIGVNARNCMKPAAPVEGLETVETQMRCTLQTGNHQWRNPRLPSELSFIKANGKDEVGIPYELRELVTRSQAEAIIAAERARYQALEEIAAGLVERTDKAEADNAALTARVKELVTVETQWQREGEISWHNEKYEFRPSGKTKTRNLVDRSDAEAMINYERKQATAAHDADAKAFLSAYNRATALEAQLAATNTALEKVVKYSPPRSHAYSIARAALEAKP